jgi:hypothetical protein
MDQAPLVMAEIEAGAELVRRLDKSIPVQAAFWLNDSDRSYWYLYIASDQFDPEHVDRGYEGVLRLASEIADPFLDPFRVNLIPTSDPLAREALDILHRYPRPIAIRLGGGVFGGMSVDGVYIYPASVTALAP